MESLRGIILRGMVCMCGRIKGSMKGCGRRIK